MYYTIDGASEFPMFAQDMKSGITGNGFYFKPGKLPSGDVHPGDMAPIMVRNPFGCVTVLPMLWGIPGKRSLHSMIPAETARRLFPDGRQFRRCAVLASYYNQGSDSAGVPSLFAVQPKGSFLCCMAGLYIPSGSGLSRFVILTRKAGRDMKHLSSRMPVILQDPALWIDPELRPERILRQRSPRMVSIKTDFRKRAFYA